MLLLLYCLAVVANLWTHRDLYQWDFEDYYYAAKAYAAGLDPYNTYHLTQVAGKPIDLPLVYPPLTLLFFRVLTLFDYPVAYQVNLLLNCIMVGALVWLWRARFLKEETGPSFYVFCLLAFSGTIYINLRAGNVSLLQHLLMWTAFDCYLRRRLRCFCILVLLAAAFRVTPIAFLLLLLLPGRSDRYRYLCGSAIVFAAYLGVQYVLLNYLFVGFLKNSTRLLSNPGGSINPATLPLVEELCRTIERSTDMALPQWIPFAAYAVIAVGVAGLTGVAYAVLRRSRTADADRISLFLACLVYALLMPRFKDYAYVLLIVPSYFLIVRAQHIKLSLALFIAAILSTTNPLPGLDLLLAQMGLNLWEYSPLLVAYGVWSLYLHEILMSASSGHAGLVLSQRPSGSQP